MSHTFDIIPMGKPRMVHSDKWRKREVVNRYFTFKDDLRWLARHAKYTIGEEVFVEFHIPMPESWSLRKKITMNMKPHQQKPDIDNLVKAFCDALTDDDSRIWLVHATKVWAAKGAIIIP